jgi:hypothetical protein
MADRDIEEIADAYAVKGKAMDPNATLAEIRMIYGLTD